MESLSVIIPVHNESKRIQIVHDLMTWLFLQPFACEVILVENGSQDDTLAQAKVLAARYPGLVAALTIPARGKGAAVRVGMLFAGGDYRMMCDVDFSMPIPWLRAFWDRRREADILIASRQATGARRVGEPFRRHVMGRVFNGLVRAAALPGISDSQCGFKMFSAQAAGDIFSRVSLAGMAFDVEALYLARLRGYVCREIPVEWHYDPDSRVNMIRDTLQMGRDILTIRAKHRPPAQRPLLENAP